jgi:hypothetical protein
MALSAKQTRVVDALLRRFFSPKSWYVPQSIEDFMRFPDPLSREIRLKNGHHILMTDKGVGDFRHLVDTLDGADICSGMAAYSDMWSACRKVMEKCFSDRVMPDHAAEFISLVHKELDPMINSYRFVVPIYGVELESMDEFTLGVLSIVKPETSFVEAFGVSHSGDHLSQAMQAMRPYLWICGRALGTTKIATEKFYLHAHLTAGLLAVAAASLYERGATGFRMGIISRPEDGHGRGVTISWSEHDKKLITSMAFIKAQPLILNSDMAAKLKDLNIVDHAVSIVQSETRNDLEEALVRAVYWFFDAHRDTVPVMQLVKFWSCIESFFSADQKDITKSLSAGLASVLVYGGYGFVPPEQYSDVKRKIARLYSLRSKAIHKASYSHVTRAHTAQLSQWAAWMIVSLFALLKRGYASIEQIRAESDRLDALKAREGGPFVR